MPEDQSEQEQIERDRQLNARAHRVLGMTATILVVLAILVALARMRTMFQVSPWEALGLGASGMPWVLAIIGLGVVFSLGTTRIMGAVAWVVNRVRGKKAGH